MKFIFADSLDYVDPKYDFLEDRSPADREPYWDDNFPHEILGYAPYDGMLVSRSIVGGHRIQGKYTESQAMRFRRVGAREFLRFREQDYPGSLVFGDCGAFTYHKMEVPPYTAEDTVDFYGDGGFTHGCSVDHIIFDHEDLTPAQEQAYMASSDPASIENKRRYQLTLDYASDFLNRSRRLGNRFTPLGVIQGWSPLSMARAAKELIKIGYGYLAIGGMVPLRSPQIHRVLDAIRAEIGYEIPLHILGFAKADEIDEFRRHKITSFDTTSPLIRAFKDARNNYYMPSGNGRLKYYSAVRVPQALDNNTLARLVKAGSYSQEDLQQREKTALDLIRAYDRQEASLDETLSAIMKYTTPLVCGRDGDLKDADQRKLDQIEGRTRETLQARPWRDCSCPICREISVEVILFRASNRNKRRGIHNLAVYGKHINQLESRSTNEAMFDLQGHQSAAE